MPEPTRSPLAGLHAAHGVAMADYHGALLPPRFSDAVAEHHAVRQSAGFFDFSFRSLFALNGDDRIRFLHRMVSNDIKKLSPGKGTYATLLNAQGHIVVDFRVYCTEDRLLIDTDADLRDKAMQALGRYIIGDRVQLEPVDSGVLAIQGPQSQTFLQRALKAAMPLAQEYDHATVILSGKTVRVVRATSTGEEGYEIWAEAAALPVIWESLCGASSPDHLPSCGFEALESLRIEAGIPRYGPDMGEDTLPLEAGLLNALSFNKGCYVGQEIVERARSRGHVNWKLSGLIIRAAEAPAPGEKLRSDEKEIGEVTSSCVSPTLGKTIAMAYLRREVTEPGTKLTLTSGAEAEVASLPFYQRPTSSASA
jgi:glycine cleavage system T protein